jgi:predicted Zn-dependent peptidase
MVGDITPTEAERDLAEAFGSWTRPGTANADTAPARANGVTPRPVAQTTIYLVDRPGAKQSSVIMGTVGPERAATDFPAASAFDAEFGGTISSRLPRVLRQQHAWAYTVFSHIDARSLDEPVVMWASADVSRENTDSAVVASLAELGAAQAQGASTAADLQSARNIIIGSVQRIVSTDDRLADRLADLVQSQLPLTYYTSLAVALDKLTPADVTRAGAAFESPEHMVVVVVGDRATIEAPLRATGLPVVIVAPSGR